MSELLGLDMAKTVAVGDYENDLDMIKMAGIGYAVANACPALKAIADRITVSNDEHAIAKIIDDLDKELEP
jgi:hydroxymethylpyrimidine pyrophosphatase-like HAD family hydrolase